MGYECWVHILSEFPIQRQWFFKDGCYKDIPQYLRTEYDKGLFIYEYTQRSQSSAQQGNKNHNQKSEGRASAHFTSALIV